MKSLSRSRLNKIIKEEVGLFRNEMVWQKSVKPVLNEARNDYLQLGFSDIDANEQVIKEFFGPFAKLVGGAAAGGGGGSSALGLGDATEGFKTALEVKALDTLVRLMGLEPYRGIGVVVKSCLSEVIDTFEDGQIQSLFSGSSGCNNTARLVSVKFLECLEGALAARLITAVSDAVLGELGDDFRDGAITGALYKNVEDKMKEYFETFITNSGLENEIADLICSNMRLDSLLSQGSGFAGDAFGNIGDYISSGLKNLDLGFDFFE